MDSCNNDHYNLSAPKHVAKQGQRYIFFTSPSCLVKMDVVVDWKTVNQNSIYKTRQHLPCIQ
jgi:hypothetical protein